MLLSGQAVQKERSYSATNETSYGDESQKKWIDNGFCGLGAPDLYRVWSTAVSCRLVKEERLVRENPK